ncbi:hypothetical protein YA0089_27320 [Pseudomonas viridiflava]|uniref:hypothetical protein n=1 Tax=Pseudomonas viridiflava TaxID=33069 RepID=UPI0018E5E68B|nr:hypothetical protein [Pseudomonas viridiflava]MBI6727330.1 hypothetical protein [Pseudomonas viridiflava]
MNTHSMTAVQYLEHARTQGLSEQAKACVDQMSEQSAPLFTELGTLLSHALFWLVEREKLKDEDTAATMHIAVGRAQGAYSMIEAHAKASGTRIPQVLAEQYDYVVMRHDTLI